MQYRRTYVNLTFFITGVTISFKVFPLVAEIALIFLKTTIRLDDPYYRSQNAVFLPNPVKLLLLYRKHTGFVSDFYRTLSDLLCTNNIIDIVLVDFNTNAQNQPNQLRQNFSDCKQSFTESTQLPGAILDHVYLKIDILIYKHL